jgi:hypothetical protein
MKETRTLSVGRISNIYCSGHFGLTFGLLIGQNGAVAYAARKEFAQNLRVGLSDEMKAGAVPNFFTIHVLPPARSNAELDWPLRVLCVLQSCAVTIMIVNRSANGEMQQGSAQHYHPAPWHK